MEQIISFYIDDFLASWPKTHDERVIAHRHLTFQHCALAETIFENVIKPHIKEPIGNLNVSLIVKKIIPRVAYQIYSNSFALTPSQIRGIIELICDMSLDKYKIFSLECKGIELIEKSLKSVKIRYAHCDVVELLRLIMDAGDEMNKEHGTVNDVIESANVRENREVKKEKEEVKKEEIKEISTSVPEEPTSSSTKTCVVCMDKQATHMAYPCGHLSYCGTCIVKLTQCSLCRQAITGKPFVYM